MTVYDERYLMPDGTPSTAKDAGSELWVVDAKTMRMGQGAISCRIKLPQRVPYGYVLLPLFFHHQRILSPVSLPSLRYILLNPFPPFFHHAHTHTQTLADN